MTQRIPVYEAKAFEAGFEPSVTPEQKEYVASAKQNIDNAVRAVHNAASDANQALDESLRGRGEQRVTVIAGIAPAAHTFVQPDSEHKGIFRSAAETIGNKVQSVKETLLGGAEDAKNTLGDTVDSARLAAEKAYEKTANVMGAAKDATVEGVKGFGHGAANVASGAVDATKNAAEKAYEKTADVLGAAKDTTVEGAKGLQRGTANFAGGAVDATKHAAEKVYDKTADMLGAAKETVEDAVSAGKRNASNANSTTPFRSNEHFINSPVKQDLTIEEVQRRGLTADYPALLRGYDQDLASYSTTDQSSPDYLKEASNLGRDVSNTVRETGHNISEAASNAADTSTGILGAVAGKIKGAVHAVVGETPPDRKLEQQGERLIKEHHLTAESLLDQPQNLSGVVFEQRDPLGREERTQQAAEIMADRNLINSTQIQKRFNDGKNVIQDFKDNAVATMDRLGDNLKWP